MMKIIDQMFPAAVGLMSLGWFYSLRRRDDEDGGGGGGEDDEDGEEGVSQLDLMHFI